MHATAAPPLPRLLTVDDLAELLESISTDRIYELAREGQIPHVRVGRSVRFSAEAVAAWLASGGTGTDEKTI